MKQLADIYTPEPEKKAKVLILSKSLKEQGGVVNFVSMVMDKFSNEINIEHFEISKGSCNKNVLSKIIISAIDCVGIIIKLLTGKFDILQINTSLNGKAISRDGIFLFLSRIFRFEAIVFIHGWNDQFEMNLKKSKFRRYLFLQTFRRSKTIVLASRFRDSLISMGFHPDKIRVSSTMFDGEIFRSSKRESVTGPKTLLFLSRMIREKGIFELLEAFRQISHKYEDIKLDIAGDGSEKNAVAEWIEAHGLKDRVRLLGYVRGEEKAKAFSRADIFVLPSRHGEGCPVTLLEAMAAGLTVITSPVGGIPDVFTDGANGILLRDCQPGTIAEAIALLLDDGELCARIGKYNQREAWTRFESRIVTRRLEQIYQETAAAT